MSPILDWMRFGQYVAAELGGSWQASPHPWGEAVTVEHPDERRARAGARPDRRAGLRAR
ncbi:hypothetical protein [Spirillospora sp. CA-128828]|uniref:hypothetical protein n=1 Tax=Spirillospora sp. CA-128828 TaxID=3240033 RepID=UPI003D8E6B2A